MLSINDSRFFFSLVKEIQDKYEHHRDIAIKIVMEIWHECSYNNDVSNHADYDTIRAKSYKLAEFVSGCLWLLSGYSGNNRLFDGPKYNANKSVDENEVIP